MAPIFPNEEDTSQCFVLSEEDSWALFRRFAGEVIDSHQASTQWQDKLWKNVEDCHRCLQKLGP